MIGNQTEVYSGDMLTGPKPFFTANSLKFSPKSLYSEKSLYYYGYRFHSPGLGRWVNRDLLEDMRISALWSDDYITNIQLGDSVQEAGTGLDYVANRNDHIGHLDSLGLFWWSPYKVDHCTIVIFWGHNLDSFFSRVDFADETSFASAVTCHSDKMIRLLKHPLPGYDGFPGKVYFQATVPPKTWKSLGYDTEDAYMIDLLKGQKTDRWWRPEMKSAFDAAVKHAKSMLSCCKSVRIKTEGPVSPWWAFFDPVKNLVLDLSAYNTTVTREAP